VISDPLYTSGPQTCGIFGAAPGYVTSGQVSSKVNDVAESILRMQLCLVMSCTAALLL
jgi:hypothetical protein